MRSIKAIVVGSLFVIVVVLLMQLAYLFLAVAYNAYAKDYPFLNDIAGSFRYLIGIPVFIIIMFLGGYLTADIARKQVAIHGFLVGVLTASGMIIPTLENADLTMTGIVIFILSIVATTAGGLYWQKEINKIA
ncbi:MAG: hypothetical protein OQK32_09000 [Gammaproteobacteria bacterium]|nr:hypothetical protein [Gammaproteobacteria bacterium]